MIDSRNKWQEKGSTRKKCPINYGTKHWVKTWLNIMKDEIEKETLRTLEMFKLL